MRRNAPLCLALVAGGLLVGLVIARSTHEAIRSHPSDASVPIESLEPRDASRSAGEVEWLREENARLHEQAAELQVLMEALRAELDARAADSDDR